jgi:hypothetical protein
VLQLCISCAIAGCGYLGLFIESGAPLKGEKKKKKKSALAGYGFCRLSVVLKNCTTQHFFIFPLPEAPIFSNFYDMQTAFPKKKTMLTNHHLHYQTVI